MNSTASFAIVHMHLQAPVDLDNHYVIGNMYDYKEKVFFLQAYASLIACPVDMRIEVVWMVGSVATR